jgi:hypothetical protein
MGLPRIQYLHYGKVFVGLAWYDRRHRINSLASMGEVSQLAAGDGTEAFKWLGITLASHFKKLVGH